MAGMSKELLAQALAQALTVNPEWWTDIAALAAVDDFPEGDAREVAAALEKIKQSGEPLTVQTMLLRMDSKPAGAAAKFPAMLTTLDGAKQYAQELHALALGERLAGRLQTAYFELANPDRCDVPAVLSELLNTLQSAAQTLYAGESVESIGSATVHLLSDLQNPKPRYSGTGCGKLDLCIGGYAMGDFNVIAARSGGGKSDFALTLARKAAKSGMRVLYESLEMYTSQIAERVLSDQATIPSQRIRDHRLDVEGKPSGVSEFWERAGVAAQELYDLPLFIDERSRLTVAEIESTIARQKPSLVFIDNLDLMKAETKRAEKWRECEETCHALKSLAKRAGVCIVGLVQLNRTADQYKAGQAPKMSDLYGGSAVEHDASWVVALTAADDDEREQGRPCRIKAHILKSRDGMSGGSVIFDVNFTYHRWLEVDNRF